MHFICMFLPLSPSHTPKNSLNFYHFHYTVKCFSADGIIMKTVRQQICFFFFFGPFLFLFIWSYVVVVNIFQNSILCGKFVNLHNIHVDTGTSHSISSSISRVLLECKCWSHQILSSLSSPVERCENATLNFNFANFYNFDSFMKRNLTHNQSLARRFDLGNFPFNEKLTENLSKRTALFTYVLYVYSIRCVVKFQQQKKWCIFVHGWRATRTHLDNNNIMLFKVKIRKWFSIKEISMQ